MTDLGLINIFLGPQHPPVWPQTRAGVGFRDVFHASATRPRCSAAASPLSHRFFSVPENGARTALQRRKSERFLGKNRNHCGPVSESVRSVRHQTKMGCGGFQPPHPIMYYSTKGLPIPWGSSSSNRTVHRPSGTLASGPTCPYR